MQRQKAPWMWMILLSAIVTITVFSKSSPLYPLNDWVDANCFLTTGKALLSGQVLYRDVYEQKGPFLYFLHALAALVSDSSFFGVWLLEIAACFVYAWIGWRLVLQRCKRPSVLLIPGLLFLTYSTVAFSSGDSAEELALPLIAYAFAAGISIQWKTDLPSNRQALILGITEFSLFYQLKEGFYHIRLQLRTGNLFDDGYGLIEVHPLTIRTIGIHGVKGIRYGDDLCHSRDLLSLKPLGIALPIGTLVVIARSYGQLRHDADIL